MEEKILEIIGNNYNFFTGTNEAEIASAKEISTIFKEFIEWKDENVGRPSRDGLYLYWEDRFNLDCLFDYWWGNIKDK